MLFSYSHTHTNISVSHGNVVDKVDRLNNTYKVEAMQNSSGFYFFRG
jgi:hypothetical protein